MAVIHHLRDVDDESVGWLLTELGDNLRIYITIDRNMLNPGVAPRS
jgi:hypothetical protein